MASGQYYYRPQANSFVLWNFVEGGVEVDRRQCSRKWKVNGLWLCGYFRLFTDWFLCLILLRMAELGSVWEWYWKYVGSLINDDRCGDLLGADVARNPSPALVTMRSLSPPRKCTRAGYLDTRAINKPSQSFNHRMVTIFADMCPSFTLFNIVW